MGFLDQEITFDMGHLVLLLALFGFVFYMTTRKENLTGMAQELGIQPVHATVCHCPDCERTVMQQALDGQLYGCDPSRPNFDPQECNNSYRKASLHGCGIA